MYREVSCALKTKSSVERIEIKGSSRFVQSEIFEGIEGGYIGDERKIGSFIISYRFLEEEVSIVYDQYHLVEE